MTLCSSKTTFTVLSDGYQVTHYPNRKSRVIRRANPRPFLVVSRPRFGPSPGRRALIRDRSCSQTYQNRTITTSFSSKHDDSLARVKANQNDIDRTKNVIPHVGCLGIVVRRGNTPLLVHWVERERKSKKMRSWGKQVQLSGDVESDPEELKRKITRRSPTVSWGSWTRRKSFWRLSVALLMRT